MTRRNFFFAALSVAVLLLMPALVGAQGLPASAWWPEWRQNAMRTGQSLLQGEISNPTVAWRYYLGGPLHYSVNDTTDLPDTTYDLTGSGGSYTVSVSGTTVTVRDTVGGSSWDYTLPSEPYYLSSPKVADIDNTHAGEEITIWSGYENDNGYLLGFDTTNGLQLLWSVNNPSYMYTPEIQVADMDNDGVNEVVITAHYRVTIWDGVTGNMDYNIGWTVGRNYGHTTCINIDGDPYLEVGIICDFVLHSDIVDLTDGSGGGALLWKKDYRPGWENSGGLRDMLVRARPNSILDVNGDGSVEMVVNLYSESGDKKWHMTVYETTTGNILVDLADRFVYGIEDLNGDGDHELLCVGTTAVNPDTFGDLYAYSFDGSSASVIWSASNARFLKEDRELPDNAATIAVDGYQTVLLADVDHDGSDEFLIEVDTDADLQADRFEGHAMSGAGAFSLAWSYDGIAGSTINAWNFSDVNSDSFGELQFSNPATGDLVTLDENGDVLSTAAGGASSGFMTVPVAADLNADGTCEIAVMNSRNEMVLLAAPKQGVGTAVQEMWTLPGRGMNRNAGGYSRPDLSPAMADLDGDGIGEVLFAGENVSGEAMLSVIDPSGAVVWEYTFSGLGTDGIYAGLGRWMVGDFVGDSDLDVAVIYHDTGKSSNRMVMLNGNDGSVAWSLAQVQDPATGYWRQMYTSPTPAIHDFNGDGRDDITMALAEMSAVISGLDGSVLQIKWLPNIFDTSYVYYPFPSLVDLDDDGDIDIFWHSAPSWSFAAAQTWDMAKMWWVDLATAGSYYAPGIMDVDGDGISEIGEPGADSVFRCYRSSDGALLWSEAGAPPASDVGTADIDGDSVTDYFYMSSAGGLVAVQGGETAAESQQIWSLALGNGFHPIFADVDGDGYGEILVVTSDGYLNCIDQGAGSVSILFNGDFEIGSAGWTHGYGGGYTSAPEFVVQGTEVQQGILAAQLTNHENTGSDQTTWNTPRQYAGVTIGADYTLSGWIKTQNVPGAQYSTWGYAPVNLRLRTIHDTNGDGNRWVSTTNTTATTWTYFDVLIDHVEETTDGLTTGDGQVMVELVLYGNHLSGGGDIVAWYDDVQLTEFTTSADLWPLY